MKKERTHLEAVGVVRGRVAALDPILVGDALETGVASGCLQKMNATLEGPPPAKGGSLSRSLALPLSWVHS